MREAGVGTRPSPVVIGRAGLLSLARRRWLAAGAGQGQLLLLAGEAGIGKTRLLRQVAQDVRAEGSVAVVGAAFPPDAGTAGGVLLDLASHARRAPDPAIVAAGQALTARLREVDPPGSGDAHHRRRVLVTDLADALLDLALAAAPPLVCLEDLHWADDLTLDVLDRVTAHLDGLRMLVVGTYRSDELHPLAPVRPWRTRLLNQRRAEEVRLGRLSREETGRMCAAIAGAAVSAAVVDVVYERSDGIPLHVEELLAAASATDDAAVAVPPTLADAVLARARAVSPAARRLAEAASVIGRSFDPDLLCVITAADASIVDDCLRELVDHHVIRPERDRAGYEFRHALIRDALYADLAPRRCRELHRLVADASAGARDDAFVSAHYERAHEPGLAYRHARAAAGQASALSAHREAVSLLRRAQRTAPSATTVADQVSLLVELATELAAIDDNAAAADAFGRAIELLRAQGDETAAAALVPAWVAARHLLGADLDDRTGRLRDALARLAPDESTVRGRLESGLAAAFMLARRLDESIEHGERARALAAPEDPALLNVDTTLGAVLVFSGRMDEGWRLLEDAAARAVGARVEAEAARSYRMMGSSASVLVEYERARDWLTEGIAYAERTERWNDRHYMAAHLAHVSWATGEWSAAEEMAGQVEADGRSGITTHITALHVRGYLALGRGEWPAAHSVLEEARELGERMGELQRVSPALWGLAELSLHSGATSDAVALCERGYAISAEVADAAYLFPYVVTGVRARLAADDLSGAREWLSRCQALLAHRSIPGTLPALAHARGLLRLADGHPGQARDELAGAMAEWDRLARFWEGTQVRLDLARAAARSRRTAEVSTLVAEVRDRAVRVGWLPLIESVDTFAGGPVAAGPVAADASPLSPRETEVARLIAAGATNREIAAALHIAPKTVSAHVEHILTKLGAGRRSEIAAWAALNSRR